WIAAHLALGDPGQGMSVQSYLPADDTAKLRTFQGAVRDATRMACTVVQPGELPPSALFLQVSQGDAAQAQADFEKLRARGTPVLRVHAEESAGKLLQALQDAVKLIGKK